MTQIKWDLEEGGRGRGEILNPNHISRGREGASAGHHLICMSWSGSRSPPPQNPFVKRGGWTNGEWFLCRVTFGRAPLR